MELINILTIVLLILVFIVMILAGIYFIMVFKSKRKQEEETGIKSDRLKVSGIDFSNTNINIDPQLVYNRDLSNSIFDDNNFTFKSFKGCNLSGTDISKERDSVDYEEAIINDETMLPVKKDKSLK